MRLYLASLINIISYNYQKYLDFIVYLIEIRSLLLIIEMMSTDQPGHCHINRNPAMWFFYHTSRKNHLLPPPALVSLKRPRSINYNYE